MYNKRIFFTALGCIILGYFVLPFLSLYAIKSGVVFTVDPLLLDRVETKKGPKNIVFDLGNVLFKTDTMRAFEFLGYKDIFWYMASTGTLPHKVSKKIRLLLYNVLSKIKSSDSSYSTMYDEQGAEIPELMYQWMTGKYVSADIRALVLAAVEEHPEWFVSSIEQLLIKNLATMIFTPEQFSHTRVCMQGANQFIQKCKDRGYRVYILSNWDSETIAYMRNVEFPDFFNLFDGIVISGDVGCAKPNPEIYHYFLEKYGLDPHECLFIDDQIENVHAAILCNIPGLLCPVTTGFFNTTDFDALGKHIFC